MRIPAWANIEQVAVTIDGLAATPLHLGRYLLLQGTKPGQQIELSFAIPSEKTEYIVNGRRRTVTLRGSTVVDVSPRGDAAGGYPIYVRTHMQADTAPLKRVSRFVTT